jgi:nitroreductase
MSVQTKATQAGFQDYQGATFSEEEQLFRSRDFFNYMNQRRSLRAFSEKKIAKKVIENILKTASSAPSGAHKQPWKFAVVTNPQLKTEIRKAAEKEEYENYHGRMSEDWLEDLEKFDTDWKKPFLEIAPALIVVFKKSYDVIEGKKSKNYYVNESVGLATGFLLMAIHQAGLVALTHTPSPLNFLSKVLNRPKEEKPFLLIPIGYPAEGAKVPSLKRKSLDKISTWYE